MNQIIKNNSVNGGGNMLQFEGLIGEDDPGKLTKIGNSPDIETLKFYDDDLPEEKCGELEKKLQKQFNSDALIGFIIIRIENHQ